ncbi:WD repeat-containing protein 46-like [Clavelina lepadiformis]|uniref:WD repeat-containing protein 46-like n=1 Tax=Clavelina lepadiformis TaxID=159417 RepID=UPI0040435A81
MAGRYYEKRKLSSEIKKNEDEDGLSVSEVAQPEDPFKGSAPIPEERKSLYKRGKEFPVDGIKNKKLKGFLRNTKKHDKAAVNQAARYELLLTEEPGYIETAEGEATWEIKQREIADAADITSASKYFELRLDQFGPYSVDYTRNGRHLLIGGRRGHVAAFDWMAKKPMCEMNVMEAVNDVKWLHTENMFAVAQRRWTYIYDNQGIELHCLKRLDQTLKLDFLPYHFLLLAANARGFLQYLDISQGQIVSTINTKCGRLEVLCQNPANAVVLLGHYNGTVTMWSPNQKKPLVKMLSHKTALRSIAVDQTGNYLATSAQDRKLKIFDVRTFKSLHTWSVPAGASHLKFSQRGFLGASFQNVVEIYNNPCIQPPTNPYLTHKLKFPASDLDFCPYEDVLGVGCADGFVSLLVPGAGEPNYDSFESNPYRSKKQRKEWEVRALLEKIQPDMISLDPFQIARVDMATAEQLQKDKEERLGFKQESPKFEPRFKKKGRSKSGNVEKRKRKVRNEELRKKIRSEAEKNNANEAAESQMEANVITKPLEPKSALNRFKKKTK